jgi:hypothetical protein
LVRDLKTDVEALNTKQDDFDVENLKSFEEILEKQIGKLPKKIKTDDE